MYKRGDLVVVLDRTDKSSTAAVWQVTDVQGNFIFGHGYPTGRALRRVESCFVLARYEPTTIASASDEEEL